MRKLMLTLALVAAAQPLAAQGHDHADMDQHVAGGGTLPAGWQARLDRADAKLADLRFAAMGDGFHATTGPAAILWDPRNTVTGEFSAHATFTQTKAPMHPEAYGLFINGGDLSGSGANYMYFLVRGDGKYMVRHRAANGDLHTITDWTESAAIHRQDADGKATNALTVEGGPWGVRYLINGTKVGEWLTRDAPYLKTDGQVGLRINHNLDVHVSGFGVDRG
ncbi:hypothetical protein [Longimicrobium sp.]|uniref:hypothetical protein n=1 Tax=Longimicrobium sp. TaxID=2029185 RepID=UPI002BE86561|nr:hypothetical protein [Longimicrobium sp.]HSU15871.1 hypothetical protein [Longimicrobium sp.]